MIFHGAIADRASNRNSRQRLFDQRFGAESRGSTTVSAVSKLTFKQNWPRSIDSRIWLLATYQPKRIRALSISSLVQCIGMPEGRSVLCPPLRATFFTIAAVAAHCHCRCRPHCPFRYPGTSSRYRGGETGSSIASSAVPNVSTCSLRRRVSSPLCFSLRSTTDDSPVVRTQYSGITTQLSVDRVVWSVRAATNVSLRVRSAKPLSEFGRRPGLTIHFRLDIIFWNFNAILWQFSRLKCTCTRFSCSVSARGLHGVSSCLDLPLERGWVNCTPSVSRWLFWLLVLSEEIYV